MTQMRIEKLVLKGLNQFRNLHLDFTDPKTGEPLEKVCFIGPNGTGKTTLLEVLRGVVSPDGWTDEVPTKIAPKNLRVSTLNVDGDRFVYAGTIGRPPQSAVCGPTFVMLDDVNGADFWNQFLSQSGKSLGQVYFDELKVRYELPDEERRLRVPQSLIAAFDGARVTVSRPGIESEFIPGGLPQATLRDAIQFGKQAPKLSSVGPAHAADFWKSLIYQIKQREADWQSFLKLPGNRTKTVGEVEADFDNYHPDILAEVAKLWSRILDKAGLELDLVSARRPTHATDNLEAFVRAKCTGEIIEDYNVLSSGMRNFLFRLGHLFSLYFGRKIERGFLFVDEPEDSLYPDFLYDLIDIYLDIIKGQNTQFFVATHSPIIAAQFRPEERFILNFDESYHVVATRGVSPEGDDPNDLLDKDFAVASLYGKKGIENWKRFVELRRLIEHETDKTKKLALADEYMTIGNAYNFRPDETINGHAIPQ